MKIKLPIAILLTAYLTACGGESDDVADMKEKALAVCAKQAEKVPGALGDSVLEICQCNVENTDYAKIKQLIDDGDTEGIIKLNTEVEEKCAPS